jgi:hypothetical protein
MKIQILLTLIFASVASAFKWYPLGNWIEEEGTPSRAGYCVKNSMDGKIIAVAAPHYSPDDTPGMRFGRVVIYTFDEERDAWDKLGGDITGEEGDSFGSSLGMSEDGKTVIVGSLNDNKNGVQAGMVQIYVLDDVSGTVKWIQKGQTIYGANAFDEFGYSVDVKDGGEVIAVGSPGEDGTLGVLNSSGAVRVYKWGSTSSKWLQVQKVISGTQDNGRFGHSVALSQVGIIAIGAPHANDYVGDVVMVHYNATDATWTNSGPIARDEAFKSGDMFGYSVSVSFDGTTVAVGAPHHKGNGSSTKKLSGAVTVHGFNMNQNMWKQLGGEIIGSNAGDEAGTSVQLSDDGTEVAVGAPFSSYGKTQSGRIIVYRFSPQGTSWDVMDMFMDGKTAFSNLGFSVALSGNGEQVMGGAPTEGYATVYQLTETASPTSSPTREPSSGRRGGGGGKGASFLRVMFNIAIAGLVMFAIVKIIMVVRNRRSLARFTATAVNDLELAPHGVAEDGETRDVI